MSGEYICRTPLPAIPLTIIPLFDSGIFLSSRRRYCWCWFIENPPQNYQGKGRMMVWQNEVSQSLRKIVLPSMILSAVSRSRRSVAIFPADRQNPAVLHHHQRTRSQTEREKIKCP